MNLDIERIAYSLPAIILGLTLHEYCHALTAYKLGDPTAKNEGRLTLNPIQHLDLLGMIFIIFAGFGWAKPVRFNPDNLKHPRRDKALIAAAGPLANLILGLAGLTLAKIFIPIGRHIPENFYKVFLNVFLYIGLINLGLFIFNLIPIPPLDGSHIVFSGLNINAQLEHNLMRYGSLLLFAIIIIQNQANVDILPIGKAINAIFKLFFP